MMKIEKKINIKDGQEVLVEENELTLEFVGRVEGEIKTDSDGSKYVTVIDSADYAFDIDVKYIKNA